MERTWIFFLIVEGKLNPNFFNLSEAFRRKEIELMPVVYQELLDVLKLRSEVHLIVCVGSLAERAAYERTVKTAVEKLMSEQKIMLHIFSSFEADKQQDILKQINHHFVPMPVVLHEAIDIIMEKVQQWTEHLRGPKKSGAKSAISI